MLAVIADQLLGVAGRVGVLPAGQKVFLGGVYIHLQGHGHQQNPAALGLFVGKVAFPGLSGDGGGVLAPGAEPLQCTGHLVNDPGGAVLFPGDVAALGQVVVILAGAEDPAVGVGQQLRVFGLQIPPQDEGRGVDGLGVRKKGPDGAAVVAAGVQVEQLLVDLGDLFQDGLIYGVLDGMGKAG